MQLNVTSTRGVKPPSANERWIRRASIGAVGLVLSLAGCAAESGSLRTGYRWYSDATATVSSPRVDSTISLGETVSLRPYWTADVITAASPVMSTVDAMSRASEYAETRHEAGLGLDLETSESLDVGLSYSVSAESDYLSQRGGLWADLELLDKLATLSAAARVSADDVSRSDMRDFDESMLSISGDLSWTHVINDRLVGYAVYSVEHRDGYQANPYRLVPIHVGGAQRPTFTVPERLPELRTRHSAEGLLVWAIGADWFLHGRYRFYVDDWGISSHAVSTQLWWVLLDDQVRLRLGVRGYTQSSADFYESRYESLNSPLTGDFRLSAMSTVTAGLRVDTRPLDLVGFGDLALIVSYDITGFRFDNYLVRSDMLGHALGVSLSLETL